MIGSILNFIGQCFYTWAIIIFAVLVLYALSASEGKGNK
jgi:hypothetical protein